MVGVSTAPSLPASPLQQPAIRLSLDTTCPWCSISATSTSNALASTVTTLAMVRIDADDRSTPTICPAVTGSTRYPPSAATARAHGTLLAVGMWPARRAPSSG